LTQLTLVLFMVGICFDPNGSSSGYYSVTLKNAVYTIPSVTGRSHFYN